jgi:primosomal protein N'
MQASALEFAINLAERIRRLSDEQGFAVRVLGPAPAPFPKLRGNYRFHMQVQSKDEDAVRAAVVAATGDIDPPEGVEWMADVDPIDML